MTKKKVKAWIEAMRLRTLPVSIAGVVSGLACALAMSRFRILPFLICLLFAVLAQIASNFANEFYDFKKGLDKKGREGYRRGVTEGDISPKAMKYATYTLLAIDSLLGCSLIIWGGWWLIFVGIIIAFFAIGYSAGPMPLSHVGLGDVAVVIFFGIVPVIFTCYLITGSWEGVRMTLPIGFATGLLAANVLIVNNYRDAEDDFEVGKRTTVVLLGRRIMSMVYLFNFTVALLTIAFFTMTFASPVWLIAWGILEILYIFVWNSMRRKKGAALNVCLRRSALLMLTACVCLLLCSLK